MVALDRVNIQTLPNFRTDSQMEPNAYYSDGSNGRNGQVYAPKYHTFAHQTADSGLKDREKRKGPTSCTHQTPMKVLTFGSKPSNFTLMLLPLYKCHAANVGSTVQMAYD